MQSKNRNEDGRCSVSLALAIGLASLLLVAGNQAYGLNCPTDNTQGTKCQGRGEESGGSCTGGCASGQTCGGYKTKTEYNGCTYCASGGTTDFCHPYALGADPGCDQCGEKQQRANCHCISGLCDVAPTDWPGYPSLWTTVHLKSCE